ncbi:MAG: hypothetical protein AAGE52_06700 [Myxococcota bacterium]
MAVRSWCVLLLVASSAEAQPARPVVLLASDAAQATELTTALGVELAGAGYAVLHAPAPSGVTSLERASEAQRLARESGARVTMWVEEGPEGGALLRAVEVDGDAPRHAPLPATVDQIEARTFAVVASSLVDEIQNPPARIRVRVQVSVEGDGVVIDDGSARVATQDGRSAEAQLGESVIEVAPDAIIEVPLTEEERIEEEAESAEQAIEEAAEAAEEAIEEAAEAFEEAVEDATESGRVGPNGERRDDDNDRVLFGVDVAPFLGTSTSRRGTETRTISLGLAGTYSRAIEGVGISTGLNITREHVHGAEIAAAGNIAAGEVVGGQVAAGFNFSRGLQGVQLAAGANINVGDAQGAQVAAGLNIATGRMDGVQLSSGANFARGGRGAQVGLLNISRGEHRGLQLGLVNISDSTDFALGLVNVLRNGRTHIEASATAEGFGFTMLKHGGEHWHYLYSVGGRPFGDDGNDPVYSLGFGLGAHARLSQRVFLDIDGLAHYLSDGDHGDDGTEVLAQLRAVLGIQIFQRFALIGGVTYNVLGGYNDDSSYAQGGEVVFLDDGINGWRVAGWPSLMVGVQIL